MRCSRDPCASPLLKAVLSLPLCRPTKEMHANECLKKMKSPASFVTQGELKVPCCSGCQECRKCRLQWPSLTRTPPRSVDLEHLLSRGSTLDAFDSLTLVCRRHPGTHRTIPPKLLTPQEHLCACFHTCQPNAHRCSRRRQRVLSRTAAQVVECFTSMGPHVFGYFIFSVSVMCPPSTVRTLQADIVLICSVCTVLAFLHMMRKVRACIFLNAAGSYPISDVARRYRGDILEDGSTSPSDRAHDYFALFHLSASGHL